MTKAVAETSRRREVLPPARPTWVPRYPEGYYPPGWRRPDPVSAILTPDVIRLMLE